MAPNGDDFFDGWVREAEERLRAAQGQPNDAMLVVLASRLARQTQAIERLPDAIVARLTAPEQRGLTERLRQAGPAAGWASAGAVLGYLGKLFETLAGR